MTDSPKPSASLRSSLFQTWTSLTGWLIAAIGLFAFLLLLGLDLLASEKSPYIGIFTYLVSPGITAFGMVLIIVGWIRHRHKLAKAAAGALPILPRIDLSRPRDLRLMIAFVVLVLVFLMLTSVGSYQAYHVTKSPQFCGETCHQEMGPQFVTYQHSPHARVECTACHIGGDAVSHVKAKFNGLHQVYVTLQGKAAKPIHGEGKIDINQKRCEQCHWPQKFVGNLDRTYAHYLDNETNSPYSVRLLLKVGGGDPTHGPVGGIHWHMNLGNKVEYIATDPQKQTIPWVRHTDSDGNVTEFRSPDFEGNPSDYTIRTMDCMDCHNRPAHQFRSPNDAVDLAMHLGKISTNLPSIKRTAVLALTRPYDNTATALKEIASSLRESYASHPDLDCTINEVQSIYKTYFFPEMKTDWRTHPNNIGHKDWPGCFRCHDGEHATVDGSRTINHNDCNSCHIILAEGVGEEFDQLHPNGAEFKHPEEGWDALNCSDCHNGSMEE